MDLDSHYRYRKATDINRKFATFELVEDDVIILDVGFSDQNVFEICFHNGISGLTIDWPRIHSLILEGRQLAELDRV